MEQAYQGVAKAETEPRYSIDLESECGQSDSRGLLDGNLKISNRSFNIPRDRAIILTLTLFIVVIFPFATIGIQQTLASVLPRENKIPIGNEFIYGDRIELLFEPAMKYRGPNAAQAWKDLQPPGLGFVKIAEHNRDGLGPPVYWGTQQGYCISAFHQLHCLASIHEMLWSPKKNSTMKAHTEHCFDYIRQSIMCAGDTTLEHVQPSDPAGSSVPEHRNSVDGWNVVHQCRNWDSILKFADENGMTPPQIHQSTLFESGTETH